MLFANLAAIAIQNARTYEEMERQAISDGLTGIHNYRHFHESLHAEVSRAGRYGEHFCLLMMDLDHFKAVNDTIGHQKGDDVLRAVAGVLRCCSRESDYLARYGGEEFAMILPRTDAGRGQDARRAHPRPRCRVLDPGHPDLHVTMSIGVSSYPESAKDSDGVLGAADAALLRAKSGGRDRVCLYTDAVAGAAAGVRGRPRRRRPPLRRLHRAERGGGGRAGHRAGGARDRRRRPGRGAGDPRHGPDGAAEASEVRQTAVEALVYGNERWDGGGYPEGRRGVAIPRVARAFAVCRRWDPVAHNGDSVADLRDRASHELDPKMVQRFTAMLRADKAVHN